MISNSLIRVITVIISAVFVGATWLTTGTADLGFLHFFSAGVFIASLSLTVWDRWVWKLRFVQKFSSIARDVSGTWETKLVSFWIDPNTGERPPVKTVYIVVRQTSAQASVSLLSHESKSRSSLARVVNENGSWVLHYIYANEPAVDFRDISPIHHGSGVLEIVGNPASRVNGKYWTDRDTKGTLALRRRSRKLAEDFHGATELFD